ncbi:lectin protein kinase family protein [Actinidia rufa]|uniref:Lectin protein kinase family protein n=1 Tax=Actinidia rufa TaxID=165716 RepID=A0A7J0GNP9_9ERIC|nr:lectin protein kinase family protein [Actinidia rufa]
MYAVQPFYPGRKTSTKSYNTLGQLQYLSWLESTREWILFWSQPRQECEVYAYCGAFSSCNQNAVPFCECLRGFQPLSDRNWNAGDKSGGWSRRVLLQCGKDSQVSGQKDRFVRISKVRLPVNPIVLQVSPGVCESACLSNCSCSAYAYGDDGCSIWIEDLLNMQQLKSNDPNGRDLYLKLASSEFQGEDLLLFDPATSIGAATHKRSEDSKSRRTGRNKEVDLPLFSIASVSAATDNFSDANKLGEGGFGPVYKGKILKGHEVAVKRLSRKSGQGLEELQNEALL